LEDSVTKQELKQIDYFLRRLPIFDHLLNHVYILPNPFSPAIMRTSVHGAALNIFSTPGESSRLPASYYEAGQLPKNIDDATFIFEYKNRILTASKKTLAFVYTGPNDSFLKSALLHSTFYRFLNKHHLVQDFLHRIVVRSSNFGKSLQYLWIVKTISEQDASTWLKYIFKEMMPFLWMAVGGKPECVELVAIHPMSLKIYKGDTFDLVMPETVDSFKDPISDIETSTLNLPFAFEPNQIPSASPTSKLPKNEADSVVNENILKNELKPSLIFEEQICPLIVEPKQTPTAKPVITRVSVEPMVCSNLKSTISPEILTCLINSEILSSRLLVSLSGISVQTLAALPQIVPFS
jgi:hypothetical protein